LEPPSKSLNGGLSGPNRVQSTLEHSVQFADSVHRPLVESPLSVVSVSPLSASSDPETVTCITYRD
jgi:hypothetical protein